MSKDYTDNYYNNKIRPTASRYFPLWAFPFRLPLKVFKTRLLERGFHTLLKNVSFSSPTDVGSHERLMSHLKTEKSQLIYKKVSCNMVYSTCDAKLQMTGKKKVKSMYAQLGQPTVKFQNQLLLNNHHHKILN